MAGYFPPQLHPLLGRDLDAISAVELGRLIGAPETEWLDAKREPYGNGDSQKRELASDVAAFANRQGGLIIIGVDEDGSGTLSALSPVADEDLAGEELRITQIVSSLVAPVPLFSVRRVPVADENSCLIVSVQPSRQRPHCVAVNAESVRYPLREGTHKRYLSESEIADLYRSRFADARTQVRQAEDRHDAMVAGLDRSTMAWLVISIEPDWPGRFVPAHNNTDPLRTFGRTERLQFPSWFRSTTYTPTLAFRSLRLFDAHDKVYSSTGVLHFDGGGSLAFGWEWRARNSQDKGPKIALIADEDIVGCLVNGIASLAGWATEWAGTSGDATLLVGLYAPAEYPMSLWQYRVMFAERLHGAQDLVSTAGPVMTTVTLDSLRSSADDLLAITRLVAHDLESAFGVFGPPQISGEGQLRWRYFDRDKHDWLRKWAEAWGITVIDDDNTD